MNEVEVGGFVMARVDGNCIELEWVEYRGRAWLVASWMRHPSARRRQPKRLIAPRIAPGYGTIAGPEMLEIFQRHEFLTLDLLAGGPIPADKRALLDIERYPPIWSIDPEALN